MDQPLSGKHAVVTGGGTGIVAAIAEALISAGAAVSIMGRTGQRLRAEAARLEQGGRAQACVADVTDPTSVSAAFAAASAAFGPVQILINNAGAAKSAPFARTGLDLWQEMLAVNLTGVYLCCQEALPPMLEAGYGRIVNIASTAALTGYAYTSAYCAAKHGVVGLTRSLALETARAGVTVNAVCPGYTETDMLRRTLENIAKKTGRGEDEARAEIAKHYPQGRLITPQEVANAVLWLCQPGAESITGQSIAVAGGEIMN
ncbi:MAG: SDR family NAD(P)-dependent oxidoreductase [Proteobacteria bacterium]|nr:SDR family NAD(P)-dependent oxidoreductase [Pseudomonadota bacterium]